MEEMKSLIISALDTKGVLGQIRAHLRSAVFKAVDEQDQPLKTGCGFKWENPKLYKILDTRFGTLLAEILRDFMEYFRMDYSLSTFIPECGINPERLRKDEILNKIGLFGVHEEYMSKLPMPLMYYIMYYFLEQVRKDPESIIKTIERANDFEKVAEDILEDNIAKLGKNQDEDIPISGDRPQMEEDTKQNYYNDNENNIGMGEYVGQGAMKGDTAISGGGGKKKKSYYEYEERRGKLSLDDDGDEDEEYNRIVKSKMEMPLQRKEDDKHKEEEDEDEYVPEEINEEIPEDILNEQSNDKKSGSNNTQTVSQSLGNDGTVDSHMLDQYAYIEAVEKK